MPITEFDLLQTYLEELLGQIENPRSPLWRRIEAHNPDGYLGRSVGDPSGKYGA